jgi:hypothetical protein
MSALSENTIKQVALGYLRSFYRLRPRAPGAATLSGLDLRGGRNIIVDGFLKYIQEDNTAFTATFEASSNDTRDEVHFRPRLSYIYWDGAVFASLTLAVVGALLHLRGFHPVVVYGPWLTLGMVLGLGLFLVLLYRALCYWLPRYRYITAIEQFKQYRADEQWIAIGYDVFRPEEIRKRRELIRQCVRYGFGLIEIDARREPRLIMAPSRAENFVPRRNFLQLETLQDWGNRMGQMARPWRRRLNIWIQRKVLGRRASRYFRWFPRTYYHQMALAAMGLLGMGYLYYQQYQLLPIHYVNERIYNRRLAQAAKNNRPEISYFVIDAPEPGFDTSDFEPFFRPEDEEQFAEIIQTEGSEHADSITLPPVRIVVSAPGSRAALYYDCARFTQLRQSFFVLTDTLHPNLARARERLAYFNDFGLIATATWPYCLGGPDRGFLVYVDEIYLDSTEAVVARDSLQGMLDSLALPLRVRKFLPPPE